MVQDATADGEQVLLVMVLVVQVWPACSNVVSADMLLVLLLLVMLLGWLGFLVVFSLHSGDGYDAGGYKVIAWKEELVEVVLQVLVMYLVPILVIYEMVVYCW